MWFLAWIVFDLVFSACLEVLFELTKTLDSGKLFREVAAVWLCLLGAGVGAVSGLLAPLRILPPGPFPGASLMAVPAVLGGFMQLWGRSRRSKERRISHLATWYGGAALGLGLALGRLGGLSFMSAL